MATDKEIIRYYEDCDIDYRLAWGAGQSFSLHYGYYDANNMRHKQALQNTNRVLAAKASIEKADHVLDAGCGIGGSCIWLASNIGARVTGINITDYQIKKARKLVAIQGLEKLISFEKMSFLETRFEDNAFDVVWGMESVCYAENKEDFLKEAFRILKPGGRLAVADGFLNDEESKPGYEEMMQAWLDGWIVPNLSGQQQFIDSLNKVGFDQVNFADVSLNVMSSAHRLYKVAALVKWGAKILELLKIRNSVQAGNFRAAEYQYPLLLEDVWRYGMVTAKKPLGDL